ncbi:MAG: glycosyltransferase [Polyangiaceae bacterium]|nr:glycosyltransferase [Polyangiaceae bacterium]
MKVLQVIHGYPMRYNAGSEVYTQTLCHGLADRHEVHVFTREENSLAPDFQLKTEPDADDARVTLHIVNVPNSRDRYSQPAVDSQFVSVLQKVRPDVIHIGHLNHVSTSLVWEAARRNIPILYTLHDYWLMCPRGQFMQMSPSEAGDPWPACDGQENKKCAERCYLPLFSRSPVHRETTADYWTDWVDRRMAHARELTQLVDLFVAPARYLLNRYRDQFHIPTAKLVYLDYGFDQERLRGRVRTPGEPFTFGYIGTHIPAKGIHHLIEAFGKVPGEPRLRIWGRSRGQDTEALRALGRSLPNGAAERVEWLSEYKNQQIVSDVFNHVDAIVVPSIWVENSPLVIHEAQGARVPIITADVGGMAEYVHHEINGLLFSHRNVHSLAEQMARFVADPAMAARLGARGYVHSANGEIPSIKEHVEAVENLYKRIISRTRTSALSAQKGPWRITFDTNPDTCNLHCVMCEEHSPHSPLQLRRKENNEPRRVMPIDIIRRVVAEGAANGLQEIIPSTMGEPLLYEHFEEILDLCRRYKLKLNLTTNGTFPRLGAETWGEKILPYASDVKISWNGASAKVQEEIMIGTNMDQMLQNLRTFVAVRDRVETTTGHRARLTLQLTFLETNVDEIPKMVHLAAKLGIDRVKGHHLWAHFKEIEQLSMRRSVESIRTWNLTVEKAKRVAEQTLLPSGKQVLLENFFPLSEEGTRDLAPGGPCPFLGKEAWVSATGRFDPCCAPDAERRQLGDFGNLKEKSLLEIWEGQPYQTLLQTYRNRSLCLGCNMRKPAEES